MYAADAHGRQVSVPALSEEVPRGEETKAERVRARGECAELFDLAVAHVVEVDLHEADLERRRLLEHVLERHRAALEAQVPAQRVDPEVDHRRRCFTAA